MLFYDKYQWGILLSFLGQFVQYPINISELNIIISDLVILVIFIGHYEDTA